MPLKINKYRSYRVYFLKMWVMDYLMHMYVFVCIVEESCRWFAHFHGQQDTAQRAILYLFVNAYIHLLTQCFMICTMKISYKFIQ